MAPVLPELFAQAFHGLGTSDWSSLTASASEKLTQSATRSNILSAILAWVWGILTPIGAFFISSWRSVDAGEVGKESLWEWLTKSWQDLSEFLLRPDVRNVLIVWFVVFWICLIPLALGLGFANIIKDSLTAWLQAAVFWAFTPAGGLITLISSIGMQGADCPPVIVPSTLIASLAAWIAWTRAIGV
ncbi:hypothetical protein OPQ81_002310 [Rhizoctonia solani]|nr:hypothetical protein OPQ81_002310 [Rhizoctonia solani]